MKLKVGETIMKGVPISRGIAIGKPFFFTIIDDDTPEFSIEDVEGEIKRYYSALEKTKKDIKQLQKKLEKERILDGADILNAHLEMMQDPLMTTSIENEIRETRTNAEYVLRIFVEEFQGKFQSLDTYFNERFQDVQDICRRVMGHLKVSVRVSLADLPPSSVVFSQDLTASDTAEADGTKIAAFVTAAGGATSHAAIVAKAKGIPLVSHVDFKKLDSFIEIKQVIIDGRTGEVIFNPTKETLKKYTRLQKELEQHLDRLDEGKELLPETYDGYQISLSANIDTVDELDILHQNGGQGVGLFRSEYITFSRDAFPTEQEQFLIYKRVVKKMKGLPIVIRTFDFGGDKSLRHQLPDSGSIRYLLKERDLFRTQLSAILRAAEFGDVSIMFPMISSITELLEAKAILKEAKLNLTRKGSKVPRKLRVGCMVEVPSAVMIADLLAKECDFLSIGTNDLVQYSLAFSRGDQSYNGVHPATDPSVIRMIKLIVGEANHSGIPVTVCGEVAGDPRFTPLLLGLGVHELSVSSRQLPVIKNAIRSSSIIRASRLAEEVLTLTHAKDILNLLTEEYRKSVPEDQLYNY